MPTCILNNVNSDQLEDLRRDLIEEFPHHFDGMVLVQLIESNEEETFCTVDSSSEISSKELTRIRQICAKHVDVRERIMPKPETAIFYDSRPGTAGKVETILESFVTWKRSNPQFLNNNPAPYLEIHGGISKTKLRKIRELSDVEVWGGDKMTFYPQKK